MKKVISFIFALAACFSANAVIVQKMTLKNGTVLCGYIQQQDGSKTMTFRTEEAIVYVDNNIVNISENTLSENSLNKRWKEWAADNDAFTSRNGANELALNNLNFHPYDDPMDSAFVETKPRKDWGFEEYLAENKRSINGVKVLEKGVKVKYIELTPNTYTVSWDDVFSIKSEKRAKNALSGINRTYQLKSGETVEGQYAEETLTTLGLYVKGGMTQTFNFDDVVKFTLHPINPNQDIFEQSELIDVIKRKNGGEIRGIIVEQNQTSGKNPDKYFLIKQQNGATESVLVSNIIELRKEENPQYKPKFDVLLKIGETLVNGKETKKVNVTESGDWLLLDNIDSRLALTLDDVKSSPLVVQYRIADGENNEPYQLILVRSFKKKGKEYYGFSYKDLVTDVKRANSIETSVNKTTKAEYPVSMAGIYALYDSKAKKAIALEVK